MNTENKVLMQIARESLKDKWGPAVGASFIIVAISLVFVFMKTTGSIFSLLINGPLFLGVTLFYLNISRGREIKIE
jgi:uncharacterized membrane protein